MSDSPRLYVLDGSYYVFRGFFAVRGMTNSKGMPTNGLFAFTSMLLNVIRDHRPEYLVVAFDPHGPTFRNEMYAEYKANRDDPPEDLVPQFPWFRKICQALNIPIIEEKGWEADDAIGTLVKRGEREGMQITILSADKDLYQLIDEDTVMIDAMRDKRVDIAAVKERFQVAPAQVADVLGLAGDTSDNIPGVPGIGEKTAGKLIAEFGSVENLLENIDKVSGKKRKENLTNFAEQARLSKKLATIATDAPIEMDFGSFKLSAPDFDAFDQICAELNFNRFRTTVRELFGEESREEVLSAADEFDYRGVFDEADLDSVIGEIREAGRLSFDLETTSTDPLEAVIVGFALAWKPGAGVYVPVGHQGLDSMRQMDRELVLSKLKPLLEDPDFPILGQHTKYEMSVLSRVRVELNGVEMDTMLAAYLLDPNQRRYNLDVLAREFLQHRNITYVDVAGSGKKQKRFDDVPIDDAIPYASEDADVTLRLADKLSGLLDTMELRSVHDDVELPLSRVLSVMERTGVRLDTAKLSELSKEFHGSIDRLQSEIHELAGHSFNIGSTKQLAAVLFDELGLPVIKKKKTGPSTDQSVLEQLRTEHPIVERLLEYRQLTKLTSTYVDSLPTLVRRDTGRVHTSYNQAVAATGRLSSSDPNLQNIPIRTEEGRRIREAFVPEEGWVLFGGDYSQIELRVLAHMSGEMVLLDAFRAGEDIHRRTAAEIFDVAVDEVTRDQRAAAKTINFGVIYGMGANLLASSLDITRKEARNFIDRYFARISSVKPFFDGLIEEASHTGYATTLIGRKRPIPELRGNTRGRSWALGTRLAVNTPIQGTAADLIKLAMIRIQDRLEAEKMQARMLLQVHDELVFEAPPEELDDAMALVRHEMEHVWELDVPLKVDLGSGKSWADLK